MKTFKLINNPTLTSRFLFILLFFTLFSGCSKNQEKFNTDKSGLKYKFFIENIESRKVQAGEIMELKYKLISEKDSLIEETDLFRMRLREPSHPGGSIEDGLALMHIGDSALFLVPAEMYYKYTRKTPVPGFVQNNSFLKFYVKLNDIVDLDKVNMYRKRMYHRDQQQEQTLLDDYLKRANITIEPTNSGLYFISLHEGTGKMPKPGQRVVVNYTGYFIDGNIFSTSYNLGHPFEFVYGNGEVISGWEEGIGKMKVGGKYKLIIPSYLAYGSEGKGEIILPFSTLIFEIELLGIK